MTPPEFTWSTDKPTTPGWYWYRESGMNLGEPMRAWVFDSDHMFHAHLMPVQGEPVEKELTRCPGEWAGPIEPPQ